MTTNNQTPLSIGVIGLGAMGKGMASSLRRAGHHVGVCDVRFDAAEAFAKEGGTAHKTPADLAKHVDIIVSVVVNADQLASHQMVINIMEAARLAGLEKLTFATQTSDSK